jgi:hypothetical protein
MVGLILFIVHVVPLGLLVWMFVGAVEEYLGVIAFSS